MLLLLNLLNPNNPAYQPQGDPFLDLIKELKECNIPKISFVKSVEMNEIAGLSVSDTKKFIENNGVLMFEEEYENMRVEKENLINYCTKFYTEINDGYCKNGKVQQTLQGMIHELHQWEIRIKRMLCLLNPTFNVTDGFNKTTNKSYRLLKGYWIDDHNNRKRIFNKNVGITDGSIEHHFERFFKNRGYEVTIQLRLSNGFITDLIIEKDGKQSAIEFRLRNKEEFYNQFMSLEMWFKYQEIYS
jgi:hypothetical protein